MLTIDCLCENKHNTKALCANLTADDIGFLISLLNEKNDDIRYAAFLTLQKRSELYPDVYPYWDVFCDKLESSNSYQRSIGIMLIAENVKWDRQNRFSGIFNSYMSHCTDEKFITSRQTIQSILKWIASRPELAEQTAAELVSIDISAFKATQQKLILTDILNVLAEIKQLHASDLIDGYISRAITGGLLDKKSVSSFKRLL